MGGMALRVHGLIRATEDIDLFVNPTEGNITRLREALTSIWADPDIQEIRTSDLLGEYPTVRYGPPGESFVVDLLCRLGDAFSYADLGFQSVKVDGVPVRVATPETLVRMNQGTIRP